MNKVVIIDYGAGNVQSVRFALENLGVKAQLSKNHKIIGSAERVIFPGVGEAGSAMVNIKKHGLEKIIPELKQPVLGICLGMQLMCSFSEESSTSCLDIFPLKVKKFNVELKIPQMGWNEIKNFQTGLFKNIDEKSFVYFANSYYIETSEYTIAETEYGDKFSAALNKDNFYACQFHPEKSSDVGIRILKNFLEL